MSDNYKRFQNVWDPTKTDSPKRTREACTRCRHKRAKCDGQRPCCRCRRVHAECIYRQTTSTALKEQEVLRFVPTLNKPGFEVVQLDSAKDNSTPFQMTYQTESDFHLGNPENFSKESKKCNVKLIKNSTRTLITNTSQFTFF
ncbi:hypothetical protein BC936DRAFT_147817 [Jimgerdemannia flammicorona]|uniref:Zn(2)-C6 fungal-type domain-containing protein n=1 Tax=Jimgerdemannia flammicorona TaxID=994334 RepID=A0A433DLA3_9FUNG|nr:hypothetical protein BC936DRAFT_147817 [Jimgerdemannia flammicorona]